MGREVKLRGFTSREREAYQAAGPPEEPAGGPFHLGWLAGTEYYGREYVDMLVDAVQPLARLYHKCLDDKPDDHVVFQLDEAAITAGQLRFAKNFLVRVAEEIDGA